MDKIWLQYYEPDVPHEINPDRYQSLVELFDDCCQRFSDLPAFQNFKQQITYKTLHQLSDHFAAYLQNELHVKKGDRVAIMLPNCLQYPVAMIGILKAGAIIVNVNPLYTPDELSKQLNDAGTDTIIVLNNFAHTVSQALPHIKVKHIIVTELGDLFGFIKGNLFNFVIKHIKKMIPLWDIPQAIRFKHCLRMGAHKTLKKVSINNNDIAFLQYTGGTTGTAKGAMLTHRNLIANLEQASAWMSNCIEPGKETIITALPLYHIFALTANGLTFMKAGAKNVLITNPRDLNNFVNELKNIKFTAITGVNTLFNAILHHSKCHEIDFSHLKITLGGGMAVQESVAKRWQELTKCTLVEAYGLTETSPAVTINPLTLKKYNGTVGLPLPSTEVATRDHKENELAINEIGELYVKGPQVMAGYWKNPKETEAVLSEDGWLRTGDIALINENGFVEIVDRSKDMINVSGFSVYPNEVEDVIAKHEDVIEVAVVGDILETKDTEIVTAYIVPKDKSVNKQSIIHHCREHLTSYKVPKKIHFVDDLPKTNVGKILRRALRNNNNYQ